MFDNFNIQNILTWILVGGIAGLLADWVVKRINLGLFGKIIVGILGGFLGGWLLDMVFPNSTFGDTFWGSVVYAFVGAVILLIVLRFFRSKR